MGVGGILGLGCGERLVGAGGMLGLGFVSSQRWVCFLYKVAFKILKIRPAFEIELRLFLI